MSGCGCPSCLARNQREFEGTLATRAKVAWKRIVERPFLPEDQPLDKIANRVLEVEWEWFIPKAPHCVDRNCENAPVWFVLVDDPSPLAALVGPETAQLPVCALHLDRLEDVCIQRGGRNIRRKEFTYGEFWQHARDQRRAEGLAGSEANTARGRSRPKRADRGEG